MPALQKREAGTVETAAVIAVPGSRQGFPDSVGELPGEEITPEWLPSNDGLPFRLMIRLNST